MNEIVTELLANNKDHVAEFHTLFDNLQDGQDPAAVTICCSDSRVLQDAMWGNSEPGQIFSCGNIGNRVTQQSDDGLVISGDVLYPLQHTDTKTAIVVGHTGCGAVTATYDDLTKGLNEPAGITCCLDLLKPAVEDGIEELPENIDRTAAINQLVEYNVDRQVEALLDSDNVPEDVTTVGVVYDFQDQYSGDRGEIHVINVDGETRVDALQDDHPEIADRIERLWEY